MTQIKFKGNLRKYGSGYTLGVSIPAKDKLKYDLKDGQEIEVTIKI